MTASSSAPYGLRPSGRVVYGVRAFEQDAQDAMRGDIVRGIIELVTNADDAYARIGDVHGKIRVEVEHRRGDSPWRVVVRDRATGMTQQELVARIVELGARVSGFEEGQAVRGNLGRGAKDLAAFGPTLYESLKNDEYAALELQPTGEYSALPAPRKATPADRERMGIPRGNGTVVTVVVRASVRCPNHSTLKKRLCSHFQLRDIVADPKREVVLVNLNNPEEEDRLRAPAVSAHVVRSVRLKVPEYPGVEASLEIERLPERCDDPPSDPCRAVGILLKGRRAIYENTLFSFEGNPFAVFLRGRLICEHIDSLARAYDDRRSGGIGQAAENPIPIIRRSRDGLQREHPFYIALKRAADLALQDLIREEAERQQQQTIDVENERTRRDLDVLAKEAARFLQEELRNAEAEELPPGPGSGVPEMLAIIPGEAVCYLGATRTLTVAARRDGPAGSGAGGPPVRA